MHLATHILLSWAGAATAGLERRDRALVTAAGIIPDADGLGIVADFLKPVRDDPHHWYATYHHVVAHNLTTAVLVTIICALLAEKRGKTAVTVFLLFHLHLLADLLGSGGPQGSVWPIHYLYPYARSFTIEWQGQWALNAWPNVLITAAAIAATINVAGQRGYSPVEMISKRMDHAVVETIRKRGPGWGNK